MKELKTIHFKDGSFTANGVHYFIEKDISIQRAVYAEAAKMELESGKKVGKQIEDWIQVYDLANQQKFADIVVLAYNNRRGFKNFFEDISPVLKLCAVFINAEDEDRRYINDDLVQKKVKDWEEEGISQQSFFALALALLKSEVEGSESAMQSISELIKKLGEKAGAETAVNSSTITSS